jgi:hypothetical protein
VAVAMVVVVAVVMMVNIIAAAPRHTKARVNTIIRVKVMDKV